MRKEWRDKERHLTIWIKQYIILTINLWSNWYE
jgi:hypothetical protein